jgi:hypothetical protein
VLWPIVFEARYNTRQKVLALAANVVGLYVTLFLVGSRASLFAQITTVTFAYFYFFLYQRDSLRPESRREKPAAGVSWCCSDRADDPQFLECAKRSGTQ